MARIYKILHPGEWATMTEAGVFAGSAADLHDGYIHFSSADQLADTLAKHYGDATELVLLEVESESLGADLKWEPARDGQLFPHLYREIFQSEVIRSAEIHSSAAGEFGLPDWFLN